MVRVRVTVRVRVGAVVKVEKFEVGKLWLWVPLLHIVLGTQWSIVIVNYTGPQCKSLQLIDLLLTRHLLEDNLTRSRTE